MTIVFIIINKSFGSFNGMLNYFIVQEFLGFCFILLNFPLLQFFILLFKIGIAPFHFWIFSVLNNMSGFPFVWFLTFQKLPFIPVVFHYFFDSFFFVLFFGIIVCYLQIFFLKSYKLILAISATESFSWLCIMLFFSFFSGFVFVLVYLIFFFFVLDYSNVKDLDFYN